MKKGMFFIALFAFAQTLFAQVVQVPPGIQTTFSTTYPTISDVQWTMDSGHYWGEFTNSGRWTSVMYDNTGKLMETRVVVTDADLPLTARESQKNRNVSRLIQMTDSNGIVTYRATIDDSMMFDSKGNLQPNPKDYREWNQKDKQKTMPPGKQKNDPQGKQENPPKQ